MDTGKTCYLFLDYDGTVCQDGGVAPQTKEALETVQRAGHRLILSTGRSRGYAPEDVGIRWDGVLYGGADYTYLGERQLLYRMDLATGEAWFRSAMERRFWIIVEGDRKDGRFWFDRCEEPLTDERKEAYLAEYRALVADQVLTKLSVGAPCVADEPTEQIHVIDHASEQLQYLELFPKGTDKGVLLREFCRRYEIEKAQTIAFGDGCNDLAAFRETELAVAMRGAPSVLAEAATYQAKTRFGVAEGIRHYFPTLFS